MANSLTSFTADMWKHGEESRCYQDGAPMEALKGLFRGTEQVTT
jgi:hypothetical protein